MKVFQRKWRMKGRLVFIYLDDILVVGKTEEETRHAISLVLKDLADSGMRVNYPKSELIPVQNLTHLRFQVDFKTGCLLVPSAKLKTI